MKYLTFVLSIALAFNPPLCAIADEYLSPTPEQAAIIREAHCALTQIVGTPIYDAEGYYITGQLNECSQDKPWLDVSTGANAPKPGEKLVFVSGRYLLGERYGKYQDIMFQRGRPNTSYVIKGDSAQAMFTSSTLPNGNYDWKNAKLVLPFMPTEVHDQGDMGGGKHLYLYGALEFVPGHESDAYPLNANSIIVAVDGISFNAPRAFSASLEYPAPGQRYLEVIYFQHGDLNGPMRRAYIPVFPKSSVPQWDGMVDSNPMFGPNYKGLIAGALTITLLAAAIYALSNTELGRQMREDYERCERSPHPGTVIC